MDIQTATNEIKNTVTLYLEKNEYGDYLIPIERQRPIFLLGAPGIGKTAIMEQITKEMGIGLVAYSITHHTRQSALGLPFIVNSTFRDHDYRITEYTMSEIIAAVYKEIEKNGHDHGILFIDEINSASETLAPTMLQFLQSKIFGTHRVPDGWIIVSAGNPPEYNKSVRDFDIVTMDRVKKIEIEPDFEVWKNYAYLKQLHISILSYLELFHKNFYYAENSVDGMLIVTPRGWEDLSLVMKMYEMHKIEITEDLVVQYIQHPQVSKEFFLYYLLFVKYKKDFDLAKIFNEKYSPHDFQNYKNMKTDEKIAIIGLIIEGLTQKFYRHYIDIGVIKNLLLILRDYRNQQDYSFTSSTNEIFESKIKNSLDQRIEKAYDHEKQIIRETKKEFLNFFSALDNNHNKNESFIHVKSEYDRKLKQHRLSSLKTNKWLSNSINFIHDIFGNKNELYIFLTEITLNPFGISFLNDNKNNEYLNYSSLLLISVRSKKILSEIDKLDLNDSITLDKDKS
jgi:hypothetical protein